MHGTLGTPDRPLYFLHVPKTAGSAFTRMLDDAFPVGTRVPGEDYAGLGGTPLAEALTGHGVLAGHFGLRSLALAPLTTITILREPAARAWSHFRYRPLALPPRVNATRDARPLPPEFAARVRALSPIDLRLHAEAGRRLDRALAALPPLPPEPLVRLPYAQGMEAGLHGSGFHRRTHAPGAGWHRWTGPGCVSELRLPVRLAGPATLTLAVLSACDDDAVRSLRLTVQGAPVAHRLEPPPGGLPGVLAVADVTLDPGRPLTVAAEVAHTRRLTDPATGELSPDPAGLALGKIAFA